MPSFGPCPLPKARGGRPRLARLAALAFCLGLLCCAACAKTSPPPASSTSQGQTAGAPPRRAPLGHGDELAVTVWRNEDLKSTVRVDEAGRIALPLLGEVQAGGRTASELRAELARSYAKYVVDPQVTVTVVTQRSQTALVLGEVKTQGAIPVDHDMTLIEAVARSGGFTENAGRSGVFLLRMEGETPKVYVMDMRLGSDLARGATPLSRYLQGGDLLYVPKSTIASIEEFMGHVNAILTGLVNAERFFIFIPQVRDAWNQLQNGPQTQNTTVINQPVAGEQLNNARGGVITTP